MTETIFGILAIVLCVIGAASVIKWAALNLAASGCKNRIYAVLLKSQPDIELQMLLDTVEWDDTLKNAKIYAIDGGIPDDMADYCKAVCEGSRVKFVPYNEAESLLYLFI